MNKAALIWVLGFKEFDIIFFLLNFLKSGFLKSPPIRIWLTVGVYAVLIFIPVMKPQNKVASSSIYKKDFPPKKKKLFVGILKL